MLQRYEQVEDLLTDESFLAWHTGKKIPGEIDWDQWISENEAHRKLAAEAVSILKLLQPKDILVPEQQLEAAAARLMNNKALAGSSALYKKTSRTIWVMTAAAVVVLVLGTLLVKMAFFTKPAVSTEYGELKTKWLPDGSEVLLNANSQLSYTGNWSDGKDREVWIQGEAFFKVKKTTTHSRFIVHTRQFDIHVTGTRFNVMDRENKSNILLEEGQVILKRQAAGDIVMVPGDFLEFRNNVFSKAAVSSDGVVAWKEKKMVFNNTLLSDAIITIRQHYGVTVKLSDPALGNSRLTGMLPNDNLEVLVGALAALNEYTVVHNNDEIIITKQVQP